MSSEPILTVILKGRPIGKARPRFRIVKPRGRPMFVSTYTEPETVAYENRLKVAASAVFGALRAPLDEPLSVVVEAWVPIPKSFTKAQVQAALKFERMPPAPDTDNYVKIAMDALNKVIWRDDSLIVRHTCQKAYSAHPRMIVKVWRWNERADS